uniref:Reverse transcriptase domain-containing protein n=1 Tax=Tanacetum cinerariifolium TaxID=118510 RepID=A0A6L2P3F2_TANCI|nr:reverse transcriptase domain-containing protein [Tanacetum cinerariifolium]
MDKIRRDKRKEVHARLDFGEGSRERRIREGSHYSSARTLSVRYHNQLERLKVRDRLRYNDRHVLDRLGHQRQGAFDRLSETNSPSATTSRPDRTSPRDRSRNRSRPHRWDFSNGDRSQSRECSRGIGESYDNSHSSYWTNHRYRYRDRGRSRCMKRGRDSESPLSRISERGSSDGGHSNGSKKVRQRSCRNPQHQAKGRRDHRGFHGTVQEMMITTVAFIRGEAAVAGKKKCHTSWRTQDQSKRHTSEKRSDFREKLRSRHWQPVVGPLFIEAEISGHMIHRMYVDGGSSTEALYEHCFNRLRPEVKNQMVPTTTSLIGFGGKTIWPLGQLKLLVTIGDDDHSTRAWMNFMIVKSLSPYNGIIGRHGIKEIQAVPSTTHGMLKFPADEEIVTIRSTILIHAEYAMVIESSKEISKEAGVRHENFKVALHPNFPDQDVAIEGTLSEKGHTELCSLLKENLDIFAWQQSDMT